jgi:hypothetical protein
MKGKAWILFPGLERLVSERLGGKLPKESRRQNGLFPLEQMETEPVTSSGVLESAESFIAPFPIERHAASPRQTLIPFDDAGALGTVPSRGCAEPGAVLRLQAVYARQ